MSNIHSKVRRGFSRTSTIRVLVAILAAAACGESSPTSPATQPESPPSPATPVVLGHIVFQSNRNASLMHGISLYSMDTLGNNVVWLTPDSSNSVCPTGSPDGKLVAYYRTDLGIATHPQTFEVMNSDGTGKRKIADIPIAWASPCPKWSRDGSLIAFIDLVSNPFDAERRTVRIYTLAGVQLYNVLGGKITEFDISPDNKKITLSD